MGGRLGPIGHAHGGRRRWAIQAEPTAGVQCWDAGRRAVSHVGSGSHPAWPTLPPLLGFALTAGVTMGGVLLAAPVNLVVTIAALPMEPVHLSARGVAGLLYIAAVSQFPGFVVWYRGMALMGVTRASQLRSTPWKAHPRKRCASDRQLPHG